LCILAYDAKDIPALADWSPSGGATSAAAVADTQQKVTEQSTQPAIKIAQAPTSGDRIFISPLAKKTALEKNLDFT